MDKKGRALVDSLKKICQRDGLKVYEERVGRCMKHAADLEKSGMYWLCWDCQLELAGYTSGHLVHHQNREISSEEALNLFGRSYPRSVP